MENEKSKMFSLSKHDFLKAMMFAVFSGMVLPLSVEMRDPSFSIFSADWKLLLDIAITGGMTGFLAFIGQTFLSDERGKVFGKIG